MRYYGTASCSEHGGLWTIHLEPHVMIRFKRMFPRVLQNFRGDATLQSSPEMAQDLEWFMMRFPLEVNETDLARLTALAERHREQRSLVAQLLDGQRVATDYDLAVPPRGYQRVAADVVLGRGSLLLLDDLGLGKTCCAICVLSRAEARPALVVTKAHLTDQWQSEFQKFTPGIETHIIQKGTPYDFRAGTKKQLPGQVSLFQRTPEILITTYTKLAGWAETLAPIIRTVIYDEVQDLRHPDTNKYRASAAISSNTRFRMGLTATPIYNYGNEIFSVADIISPGELGSKSEFMREWCGDTDSLRDPKAFGTYAREHGLMLRRTAKEVGMDLPKLTPIIHTIDSDPRALLDIESPAIELAKIILKEGDSSRGDKFRASGEFTDILRQATGIAKAPYVAEFVRMILESGEKVILWGWHHAVYNIWRERLKEFNPVMFTGMQSPAQKRDSKRQFIEGSSNLLIMSLRSGDGTDGLQKVCHVGVVGELDWSPQVHKQCGGRIDRPGQELPVMLYYLVARDGSDPIVVDVLGLKKEQSDGILDPEDQDIEILETTERHTKAIAAEYLKRHQK